MSPEAKHVSRKEESALSIKATAAAEQIRLSRAKPRMKVDAEVGLSRTAQEVQGSIPTKGATLFSVISDMIAICQAK